MNSLAHQKCNALELPRSREVVLFEQQVHCATVFRRITQEDFTWFSAKLVTKNDPDSYLTSPTYYAFTGRKGLWVYDCPPFFIPFCWHPNIEGQLLVFLLEEAATNCKALSELLYFLPKPPNGIRLARLKTNQAACFSHVQPIFLSQNIFCAPVMEKVLDWKYPVHILSTEKVARMQGSDFHNIRNHVRQIYTKNVRVEPIDPTHFGKLKQFVAENAGLITKGKNQAVYNTNPYERILELLEKGVISAEGFLVLLEDQIQLFVMWDVSNIGQTRTANRFVNLCSKKFRGLSEFGMVHTSEILFSQGIRYLNIGGAENATLDSFKKKFMPVRSIGLCSMDIMKHDASFSLFENFSPRSWPREHTPCFRAERLSA